MSRIARAVLEGVPHHVTQRGNGRQVVFDTAEGYRLYLDLLREYAERFHLSIAAYCLMRNHVHLIAVPQRSDSLARALGRTHAQYARYLNLCRRSCGHVWQARYYSCALGENHLWNAMAYVERNPVRARMTARAIEYEWSSAAGHIWENTRGGFLDLTTWSYRYDGETWREFLDHTSEDESFGERLQQATMTGRPYCDTATTRLYEQRLGRALQPRPTGRPRTATHTLPNQQALAFGVGE